MEVSSDIQPVFMFFATNDSISASRLAQTIYDLSIRHTSLISHGTSSAKNPPLDLRLSRNCLGGTPPLGSGTIHGYPGILEAQYNNNNSETQTSPGSRQV